MSTAPDVDDAQAALLLAKLERSAGTDERAQLALRMLADRDQALAELAKLTAKQMEVARLITKGFDRNEVARLLHCSLPTVNDHLKGAFKTLDIHRQLELATLVVQARLA